MAEPKFKWKSWNMESNDRGWFKKPNMRLITGQLKEPDNNGLEYNTKLMINDHLCFELQHRTYADAIMNHHFYAAKYELKKK